MQYKHIRRKMSQPIEIKQVVNLKKLKTCGKLIAILHVILYKPNQTMKVDEEIWLVVVVGRAQWANQPPHPESAVLLSTVSNTMKAVHPLGSCRCT